MVWVAVGWGQREVEEVWRRGGGVGGVISFGCVESKADVVLLLEKRPAIKLLVVCQIAFVSGSDRSRHTPHHSLPRHYGSVEENSFHIFPLSSDVV